MGRGSIQEWGCIQADTVTVQDSHFQTILYVNRSILKFLQPICIIEAFSLQCFTRVSIKHTGLNLDHTLSLKETFLNLSRLYA